jgi:hypothetical protein
MEIARSTAGGTTAASSTVLFGPTCPYVVDAGTGAIYRVDNAAGRNIQSCRGQSQCTALCCASGRNRLMLLIAAPYVGSR